jgi:Zn-dependent protease
MNILDVAAWVVFFILSATVHEAAHAWAAKKGGDLTAYMGGQVSLNPLPHIKRQPLGMIVFPLVSSFIFGWPFGYASTPYDPLWAYDHPRKAAWMAAAGPAANLLIVVICTIFIRLGIVFGVFVEPDWVGFQHIVVSSSSGMWTGVAVVVSMLFTLNLIMVVLNLLPLPPLDGSGMISLFLNDDIARRYRGITANPVFGLVGLFVAWQLFNPLFRTVFLGIMNIIYWGAGYG